MSPLAFDKQGKPFSWHTRASKLRVRLFRTPSSRGTCSQVLDSAGNPQFVDANIDYPEFRRVVGNVTGLYRLDQCDEDGVEIEGASPGYVSIEQLRNAAPTDDPHGDVSALAIIDRLVATQERLVATQADVMKQMASQHAAMLTAGAEVMRAPYRAAPPTPAAELRNADATDENDDESDDDDGAQPDEANQWSPMLRILEPHLPQLGAFLYQKFAEFVQHKQSVPVATPPAATPPMPTPNAATVVTAPHGFAESVDVAAGFEAEDFETEGVELDAMLLANAAPVPPSAPVASSTSNTTAATVAAAMTTPAPTPEQFAHLYTIRERLSPKERAIAENAISRMAPGMLTHWLAELSAMSVEDATNTIRTMVAQLGTTRGDERR